jgi:hypothetical protein
MTPQPEKAVSEAISSVQRLWFRGGISREGTPDPLLFLIIRFLFAALGARTASTVYSLAIEELRDGK